MATSTPGPLSSSKNVLLIAASVVLILIAVIVIVKTYRSTQPHVVAHANGQFGDGPKGAYLKAQKTQQVGGGSPTPQGKSGYPSGF